MTKILFICTGNICRSPTAHAIARHKVKNLNLAERIFIDSAGTSGFHCGEDADYRAIAVGKDRGIDFSEIKSRSIAKDDFEKFDLIFAMDNSHLKALKQHSKPEHHHKIHLLLEYAEIKNFTNNEVKDPYYGGVEGFEKVFDLIKNAVEKIIEKHSL